MTEPKIRNFMVKTAECTHCGRLGAKHSGPFVRTIADLDGPIEIRYNEYKCGTCNKYFNVVPNTLVDRSYGCSVRTVEAVCLLRQMFTIEKTREILFKCFDGIDIPSSTVHDFTVREGE